jgi:hypothetical protein
VSAVYSSELEIEHRPGATGAHREDMKPAEPGFLAVSFEPGATPSYIELLRLLRSASESPEKIKKTAHEIPH